MGRLRGSAAIEPNGGGALITLSLRGLPAGAVLFAVGEKGITRHELDGPKLAVDDRGVCGAAVAVNGRIVSAGFTGSCFEDRARLMDELRIRAAGSAPVSEKPRSEAAREPTPQTEPAQGAQGAQSVQSGQSGRKPPVKAPVTESILRQAEMLFGALRGQAPGNAETPPEEPEPPELIPNPFPKTFPGSRWRRAEGGQTLTGEIIIRGQKREAAAVPMDMRGGGARFRMNGRYVVSAEGRRYLVTWE